MVITWFSSSPSPLLKKPSKTAVKYLVNKSKGKRPIIEDDDSDFAQPTKKSDHRPVKKKSMVNVAENISLPEVKNRKKQTDESPKVSF
uniref:Uncharacterized protein n=1 Tax=Cannabis sativa TaxID=3483 RepID=A0A803NL31_CANSA